MFTQTQSANTNKPIENIQGQAVAKHQANKLEDALNLYLHSIEIDHNQPEWIYANAIALATQIDRCDTGFKLKRQAENIYPQSDAIARAIGLLFHQQQEHDEEKERELQSANHRAAWPPAGSLLRSGRSRAQPNDSAAHRDFGRPLSAPDATTRNTKSSSAP